MTLEQVAYIGLDQSLPLLLGLFEEIAREIALSDKRELVDRYARELVGARLLGAFAYSDGTDPFSFRSACQER